MPHRRRTPSPSASPRQRAERERGALTELAAVYRDADALFVGWSCDGSTECCRFGITGRRPYVTAVEVLGLRRAIARRGSSVEPTFPPPRRGVRRLAVLGAAEPTDRDEERCPLLSPAGTCTAYADRPLGCRTFYCARATPGGRVPHARVLDLVRRLEDISRRLDPEAEPGRPLPAALTPARRRPPR